MYQLDKDGVVWMLFYKGLKLKLTKEISLIARIKLCVLTIKWKKFCQPLAIYDGSFCVAVFALMIISHLLTIIDVHILVRLHFMALTFHRAEQAGHLCDLLMAKRSI